MPWRYVKGHTPGSGPRARPVDQRLAAKLRRSDAGCLEWVAKSQREGYGVLRVPGRGQIGAHQVAWELRHGPIPPGECVLHRCDNRLCCDPDHLFLGNRHANAADRDAKGRTATGEAHGRSKLTAVEVAEIRRALENKERTIDIARRFRVTAASVLFIKAGKRWKSVV